MPRYTKDEYFAIASALDIYLDNPSFILAEDLTEAPHESTINVWTELETRIIEENTPEENKDWGNNIYLALQYCMEKAGYC